MPSENMAVTPTSTKTIDVDLSGYERPVSVRIVVGEMTLFDGMVEAESKSVSATASGTQTVFIYINDVLEDRYTLEF